MHLTARLSSKGQIAIPKEVREELGLTQGDELAVDVRGSEIVLKKRSDADWERWTGAFKGLPLLEDLAADREFERLRDEQKGA